MSINCQDSKKASCQELVSVTKMYIFDGFRVRNCVLTKRPPKEPPLEALALPNLTPPYQTPPHLTRPHTFDDASLPYRTLPDHTKPDQTPPYHTIPYSFDDASLPYPTRPHRTPPNHTGPHPMTLLYATRRTMSSPCTATGPLPCRRP